MNGEIERNIPFFDLKRQYEDIQMEVERKVQDVMRSGQYVEGRAVKEFEKEVGKYLGAKHIITCGNGTDALRIALKANGVGQGDEVITTAFSFFATAEAIAEVGAIPVFADIEPLNFNISTDDIRRKISKKTKAIMPVHIFGMPADMDEINQIAEEYSIPVIEDACQAIGGEYKGRKAGVLGTMGCFSFYPTKNLGAFGDGGMIATNDDKLADICRAIKSHAAGKLGANAYEYLYRETVSELKDMKVSENGLYDPCKYFNYFIGENSRLNSMQAAVLQVKLKKLDEYNAKRRNISEMYSKELAELPIQVPGIQQEDRNSCWHQYAILTDEKEKLISFLEENGVGTGAFYPIPLHLQKAFKGLGYKKGMLPIAERVCKQSVCLPVFPELYQNEVEYIIDTIKKFYK